MKFKFPLTIVLKKYKKHSVIRVSVHQDPLWPALAIGIVTGLILIFSPLSFRNQPDPITATSSFNTFTQEFSQDNIPREIFIPVFELTMPIKPATLQANEWQLFDDEVSWLNISGDLSGGNIVLYAHNKPQQFGKIRQLEVGRLIFLSSLNQQKQYRVIDTFEVAPTEVHLLEDLSEDLLTMYTCSGPFDSKRFFVIAKRVK